MTIPESIQNMFSEFSVIRGETQDVLTSKKGNNFIYKESSSEKKEKARYLSQMNEMDLYVCSYCQESTLCEEDGSMVCTSCGREEGVFTTSQQEWRCHQDSNGQDQSRCGMPVHPLLPQSSLGTVVQGRGTQGFRRLQIQSAMPSDERALLDAIKIIKDAAIQVNIPATLADKACYLYSQLVKNMKIKRGPVRRALMANCQYAICKKKDYGFYICKEQLVKAYNINMNKYNEGAKYFVNYAYHKSREISEKKSENLFSESHRFVKPTEPENITEDACRKLSFSDEQIAEVTYVVRQVCRLKLASSKMPQSVAAGCLILYVKEKKLKVSLHKIAVICLVSDATAKNTYNELNIGKNFLMPKSSQELLYGKVGYCMPRKKLEDIYTAPVRVNMKKIEIFENEKMNISSVSLSKKIKK
jgi:transcription initiation factor TFIIIB Brf1 subunit/transcription initiation factor TFIIB